MPEADFDFTLLPEAELFGCWLTTGQFVCSDCIHQYDVTEDVVEGITEEQVRGSGVFYYCALCGERLRAPRH